MEETEFFKLGEVLVTNARFVVGAKSYAMRNVTSVSQTVKSSNRAVELLFGLVGAHGAHRPSVDSCSRTHRNFCRPMGHTKANLSGVTERFGRRNPAVI